jgi:hypothetical protein
MIIFVIEVLAVIMVVSLYVLLYTRKPKIEIENISKEENNGDIGLVVKRSSVYKERIEYYDIIYYLPLYCISFTYKEIHMSLLKAYSDKLTKKVEEYLVQMRYVEEISTFLLTRDKIRREVKNSLYDENGNISLRK